MTFGETSIVWDVQLFRALPTFPIVKPVEIWVQEICMPFGARKMWKHRYLFVEET